nr:hypothetical protein Itr_chr09CG03410 [Ipomoea trifida]GMD33386.1 hypothetical protein Iba_chr09cCG2080 [Ipomoea batatas]
MGLVGKAQPNHHSLSADSKLRRNGAEDHESTSCICKERATLNAWASIERAKLESSTTNNSEIPAVDALSITAEEKSQPSISPCLARPVHSRRPSPSSLHRCL